MEPSRRIPCPTVGIPDAIRARTWSEKRAERHASACRSAARKKVAHAKSMGDPGRGTAHPHCAVYATEQIGAAPASVEDP
jgi:hypothetical protein